MHDMMFFLTNIICVITCDKLKIPYFVKKIILNYLKYILFWIKNIGFQLEIESVENIKMDLNRLILPFLPSIKITLLSNSGRNTATHMVYAFRKSMGFMNTRFSKVIIENL